MLLAMQLSRQVRGLVRQPFKVNDPLLISPLCAKRKGEKACRL